MNAVIRHELVAGSGDAHGQIHAGLRVRLLERDQDWLRIRLANGLEGWLRDQDVGRL